MRFPAVFLLAFAPAAFAAELCDSPGCTFRIDYAQGGALDAPGGAVITFGPGGALDLGESGAIALGEGGAIVSPTAEDGMPPDFSDGGTIVLGPGGRIDFGTGGSLQSGEQGGMSVAADARLEVQAAKAIFIDSGPSVHVGEVEAEGTDVSITLDAPNGSVEYDEGTPIRLATRSEDSPTEIAISTRANITLRSVTATDRAPDDPGTGGGAGQAGEPGAGGTFQGGCSGCTVTYTGGSSGSVSFGGSTDDPTILGADPAQASGASGGSLGLLLLGVLAGAALRRGRLQCAATTASGSSSAQPHVDQRQDRRPVRP